MFRKNIIVIGAFAVLYLMNFLLVQAMMNNNCLILEVLLAFILFLVEIFGAFYVFDENQK